MSIWSLHSTGLGRSVLSGMMDAPDKVVPRLDDSACVGSPTCATVRYLTLLNGQITASESISDIILARQMAGLSVEVDNSSISHLLHDGFVPQPFTVYRDIFAISVGFAASVVCGEIHFRCEFPFRLARSRADQIGDSLTLLEHLSEAVDEACGSSSNPILLLSAGLDSTGLAVAAKHRGRDDLVCVTYGEQGGQSEVSYARAVCKRLGLRHEAYILDVQSNAVRQSMIDYAAAVPEPCADPALIATVSATAAYGGRNSTVLDGSGSDYYFWSPPRWLDLLKVRLAPGRLPGARSLRALLPFYTRHERLLSSPVEPYLLHGSWLRHCDSRRFFPGSVDTHEYWMKEFQAHGDIPAQEARFQARALYVGPGAHMKKTRNAALAVGATARFPWADRKVADYCFNLKEPYRFDRETRKAKILVRQMLRDFVGYDDELVGKRPFLFGKRRFLEAHMGFCREEILNCRLWSPQIENEVARLENSLLRGCRAENALLSLVMVSMWHNHWFTQIAKPLPLRAAV